ncbi:uncharacterized protein LOC124541273 [Vanessa cardui]|uniref:uncharacterized protein LOC124541273 n=1 Tax=Vanessa cardui TaxID=171605 RepID=UPI001F144AD2|nr:uncharacterized protein LOC124541273 [Vanessa cardui]
MRETKGACPMRGRNDNLYNDHDYNQGYFIETIKNSRDFECQCKIDICTCKRVKHKDQYFNSHQVYRSQRYTAGFADVGVGSVKTVCRKRVRRIYLPQAEEKAVGSPDVAFDQRKANHCEITNYDEAYLNHKKTSSKCVGGEIENVKVHVLSKKLSPIIKKISNSTSPIFASIEKTVISSYTQKSKISTQIKRIDKPILLQNIPLLKESPTRKMLVNSSRYKDTPTIIVKSDVANADDSRNLSSDSLVQHVHNLENPSNENTRTSNDFIENKLEREYRKIFTSEKEDSNLNNKDKHVPELKSASILRRRFEALRRGLNKKEKPITIKNSSKLSVPSKKDVSIASDPPSLESRSYSKIKVYSPMPSIANASNAPMSNPSYSKSGIDEKESPNWPADSGENDCHDVKDMFRLWGKKFNLEESSQNSISKKQKKKVQLELPKEKSTKKEKGEGKRFLFFGKKNKKKPKQPFRSKQGVTAGRCELGDGLMIKIGGVNKYTPEIPVENINEISQDYMVGKDWFKRFMSKKIDSRNSVRIRWNNSMYTTSSSTVFELMDCVYKNTGVIFSSKSEVTTGNSQIGDSSKINSYIHPKVNFMRQNIQAWMIPKTITDKPVPKIVSMLYPSQQKDKNIEIAYSDQKWFIEKSKPFSRKIEFVLHSKNLVKKVETESSEYIVIDIPQNYFSETSSDDKNSSDEQVYNIVEYEKLNSNSNLNKETVNSKIVNSKTINNKTFTKDTSNDIQVRVSVKDKNSKEEQEEKCNIITKDENTAVQPSNTSNIYTPKGRDVISVRIITQRDIRDIKKPILKINTDLDDKSSLILPRSKKCELAESFLQDYYKDLPPLGINLLSWCVSNNELRGSPCNNSLKSFRNQGDVSKSCSHIHDDYKTSTIVSSCETSSCSRCKVEEEIHIDDFKNSNFLRKLVHRYFDPQTHTVRKRVSPKDSLEVFKRRKIYAKSNKSKWGVNDDTSEPNCRPACPNAHDSEIEICQKPKKKCKKKVLLRDSCGSVVDELSKQPSDTAVEGILSFKGALNCDICKGSRNPKHAQVIPRPICQIPEPSCSGMCVKEEDPPSPKPKACTPPPSCAVPTPSSCPKPCSPILSLVQITNTPCNEPSESPSEISLISNGSIDFKPILPRGHSPINSSPKISHVCICPKNQSPFSNSSASKKSSDSNKSRCISCDSVAKACPRNSSRSPPKLKSREKCAKCEKCEKCFSNDFPWPLKNQLSNTTSPKESKLSLKIIPAPSPSQNCSSKCMSGIKRLAEKVSSSNFNQKDCRPNCANRRKVVQYPCPPAPPPTMCSAPTPNKSAPKKAGLHLKKLPFPRNESKGCLPQADSHDIIHINSRENIMLKLRRSTASTEEIREGFNIKVQDEDGQTLFERRDYVKNDQNRMHFVKDMYRDSQVQRILTTDPDMVLEEQTMATKECKSDTSLSNTIEISLNLKFRQADKTKDKESADTLIKVPDKPEINNPCKSSKQIYVLQDKPKLSQEDAEKRDVNIKIMIKNYNKSAKLLPKNKHNVCLSAMNNEFSKKISEKFQTVSTGYSDTFETQPYSIHKTTIDLANSSDNNKSLSKQNIQLPTEELKDKNVIELSVIEDKNKSQVIITSNETSQLEVNTSLEKTDATNDDKDDKSATSVSIKNSDGKTETKRNFKIKKFNKEEKRRIFKQILERASEIKENKTKTEIQEIHQLLRAVLTSDSSDHEDFEVNNIRSAENLTYASSKNNYLKNSNSTTNYYLDKSSISTRVSSKIEFEEGIYPTRANISECSNMSNVQDNVGCLCNQLAAKLNLKTNTFSPCCCRGIGKIDEEINCDIKVDDKRSSHVGAETQYSEQINAIYLSAATNKDVEITVSSQNQFKSTQLKDFDRSYIIESADGTKVVDTNSISECVSDDTDKLNNKILNIKPADILQLNETKKAVLEIYAERTMSRGANQMIARLPKFICAKESQIYHYEALFTDYTRFDRRK